MTKTKQLVAGEAGMLPTAAVTLTKKRKVPVLACWLRGEELLTFELLEEQPAAAGEQKLARKWRMVANTGAVMQRFWGALVLDLDGAKFRQKMPLLQDHSSSQRVGFSESVKRTDNGLEASGKLLSNELADQMLLDSQVGFPFQASLRAEPLRVEEVQAGAVAKVNGVDVKGPVTIFREFKIAELTVTVLGADDNTATQAFSGKVQEELEVDVYEVLNMTVKTADGGAPVATPEIDKAQTLGAEQERARVARILKAADPSQRELAEDLISKGMPFHEAIEKLHEDLRKRMSERLASVTSGPGTSPAGAGNKEAEKDEFLSVIGVGQERWKREYATPKVRDEFLSEAAFLSYRKRHPGVFRPCDSLLDQHGNVVQLGLGTTAVTPLSFRNVNGDYFLTLDQTRAASWVADLAAIYDSDQPQEEYPWLGHAPSMIPWEGDRSFQQLRGDKVLIVNKPYESTIEFLGRDFRRDKSTQIQERVNELAVVQALQPEELLTALFEANGTGYDGVAFFHASAHVVGDSGIVKNALGTGDGMAGGATPTAAEMATNILKAIQQLLGFKNDRGKPMNHMARRFVVMISTNLLSATVAALGNEFVGSGVSNTLKALRDRGITIDFMVNPLMTTTTRFFVSIVGPTGGRPMIWQEEIKEPMSLGFESERYKMTGKVAFGVSSWVGAGYGRFERIVRADTA